MQVCVHNFIYLFFLLFLSINITAQGQRAEAMKTLEGHWEGAFVKNNSFQKFDIQFYKQGENINSLQILEEWHPQFGEFVLPVDIDSLGAISFNTGLGKANVILDYSALELMGQIEGSMPAIYVHMKKVPNPPPPNYVVEEVTVKNGDVSLYGHLHKPKKTESETAIIIVGGRSCYAGATQFDLYAKLLREYGISVLVFNKRGTGKSTGDCSMATVADLASDVAACKKYLNEYSSSIKNIGVLGSSAGGWVMVKAEEMTDFDFLISIVGPSTSVKNQQLQSMDYGFDFYNLSPEAKSELIEYTNMMFDAKPNEESFNRFQELLISSEKNGWKDLLDGTDIPDSAEGINNLWVRRHSYDPGPTLSTFNKPFLAIYGEIDWIVPYKENVARLNQLFEGERKDLLHVTVAHDAEHGTETKGKYVTLPGEKSYWRFFRISPSVQVSIIDFLEKYDLIKK